MIFIFMIYLWNLSAISFRILIDQFLKTIVNFLQKFEKQKKIVNENRSILKFESNSQFSRKTNRRHPNEGQRRAPKKPLLRLRLKKNNY